MIILVFSISVLSLLFAGYLASYVLKQDSGTDQMKEIADAIREGANAFMKRQYTTIGALSVVVALLIFTVYSIWPVPNHQDYAWKTAVTFIIGALCSSVAGFVGMYISV